MATLAQPDSTHKPRGRVRIPPASDKNQKPGRKRITLHITREAYLRLVYAAAQTEKDMSEVTSEALLSHLPALVEQAGERERSAA